MHIEVQMKTNGGVQGKEKEKEGRKEGVARQKPKK